MIRTPLCDLLDIQAPIVQAGMGPFGSGAELAAAVSNGGGLGTLGAAGRTTEDLKQQLQRIRKLTDRPFAVNLVYPLLTEENFSLILDARPPVFSLALGDPGALVERVHAMGALFVQQVHTVDQALRAADLGVDVIIAQGTEAGGFVGTVSAMPLVPQVVDAVHPLPVVAAGGVGEGRGLAAALMLGAQGVNIGTRFLASDEATISSEWKQAILSAASEDAIKAEIWGAIFPPPPSGSFPVVPRALGTEFLHQWLPRFHEAMDEAEHLQAEIVTAIQEGRMHEKIPYSGQTVGLIRDILPAGEIVRRLISEAEVALSRASEFVV